MAIQVQCDACFFSFSVKDEHAGKKGKCPECGTAVNVPARGGAARSSRSSASMPAAPPAARSGRTARPAPRKPSGSNVGLIVGLGGGGAVLLIALIVFLVIRTGNSGNASPNTTAGNQVAAAGNPASASLPGATPGATTPATTPGATTPGATPGVGSPAVAPVGTTPGTTLPTTPIPGGTTPATVPPATASTTPGTTTPGNTTPNPGATTTAGTTGASATPSADTPKTYASAADLIEAVMPSCCRIEVKTAEGGGLGSGFVVDKAGIVVTNYHVIEGGSEAKVVFPDDSSGKVVGFLVLEPKLDLAVLKIEYPADKLQPVRIATKEPRSGENVVAIGAPLGLSFSSSQGNVSAVRKEAEMKEFAPHVEGVWIQTSTPISGGNSGGPLFNMQGEVIAANTMSLVAPNAQNLNFGTSYVNIRKAIDKKTDTVIAMSPAAAPKRRSSGGGGGRETVADETKTAHGKKLLSEIKEILLQEINISFDRTGEVTAYVRNMAEKAWKQAGVEVSSDPRAPAFMLIVMRFKKGTGNASNSILECQAHIFVRDESGPRPQICKVWSDTEEVGTISESALAVGKIPDTMKKKVLAFFNSLRSAYKLAGVDAKKAEEEEKKKKEEEAKKAEGKKDEGKKEEEKKDKK